MARTGEKRTVAVVGGGIAGLSAAWLLSKDGDYDVIIYERHPHIGMDAQHVDLDVEGQKVRVDIPFRVFSPRYYRNLTELYKRVGARFEHADYSSSYCSYDKDATYFQYFNLFVGPVSIPIVLGKALFTFSFWRMARDFLYFFSFAKHDLASGSLEGMTFGDYMTKKGYSKEFFHNLLVPALGVMLTCRKDSVLQYPADMVVYCLLVRHGFGVKRVIGGNRDISERLSAHAKEIKLNTSVKSVESLGDSVRITAYTGEVATYDHVVLATQANQALKLLKNPSKDLAEALAAFPYETSDVVVHTDPALMPAKRAAWSSINIFNSRSEDMPSATIWLNKVDANEFPLEIFQTWNPYATPAEGTLLGRATFQRPVLTVDSVRGMHALERLQGEGHIWLCGSYARFGMPLLENGVRSALQIADQLGVAKPWECPEPPSKTSMIVKALGVAAVASIAALHLLPEDGPVTKWIQELCPVYVVNHHH